MVRLGDLVSYTSNEGVSVGRVVVVNPINNPDIHEEYRYNVQIRPCYIPLGVFCSGRAQTVETRLDTWRMVGEVTVLTRVNRPDFLTKGNS